MHVMSWKDFINNRRVQATTGSTGRNSGAINHIMYYK